MKDCIFCKIINGEIPSYKIFENEHTYAFLDISNDSLGHTLVVPKNHTKDIFEADEKTLCEVIKTTKLLSNHYLSLGASGVNIQNNSGEVAGQSVFHLHFHILPRGFKKSVLEKNNLHLKNPELQKVLEFLQKKVDTQ